MKSSTQRSSSRSLFSSLILSSPTKLSSSLCLLIAFLLLISLAASCSNNQSKNSGNANSPAASDDAAEQALDDSAESDNSTPNDLPNDLPNDTPDIPDDVWEFYNGLATAFVNALAAADYESAVGMFDDQMKKAYDMSALQHDWALVTTRAGAFIDIHKIENLFTEGYYICFVTARHSLSGLTQRIVFTEGGLVAGMFIEDYPDIESDSAAPAAVLRDGFSEVSVIIGEGTEYPLNGLLTIPSNMNLSNKNPSETNPSSTNTKVPAVVLVHGSGPSNMNSEVYGITVFKDIAEYLSQNGIAVLRYDKRTFAHASTLVEQYGSDMNDFTVFDETIEDAIRAKQLLSADARIDADNIYVVGLSLGGCLAPRIVDEGDFAGAVIMAGTMRSLTDVLYDQLTLQISLLGDESERLRQTALLNNAASWSQILSQYGLTGRYIEEMDSRPAEHYLAATQKPFLVLQGSEDNQIYREIDFALYEKLAEGHSNIETKLYDNLTHLFTPAKVRLKDLTLENFTDISTYYASGTKVDTKPLQDIAEWVTNISKASSALSNTLSKQKDTPDSSSGPSGTYTALNISWAKSYMDIESLTRDSDFIGLVEITGIVDIIEETLEGSPPIYLTVYTAKVLSSILADGELQIGVKTQVTEDTQSGAEIIEIIMTGKRDETGIIEIVDDPLMSTGELWFIFARKNESGPYTVLSGPVGRFSYNPDKGTITSLYYTILPEFNPSSERNVSLFEVKLSDITNEIMSYIVD